MCSFYFRLLSVVVIKNRVRTERVVFRESGSTNKLRNGERNKTDQFICEHSEKYSDSDELEFMLDGFKIDSSGNVYDLRWESGVFAFAPMWKVRADGSTYDNIFLKPGSENGADLRDLKMKLIDSDHLSKVWIATLHDGSVEPYPEHILVRISIQEIDEIKAILKKCPIK